VRIPEARGVAVDGATGGDDDGGGGRGGAGEALLHVLVLPPQQGSHAAGAKIERVSSWRRETKELATCWVEFLVCYALFGWVAAFVVAWWVVAHLILLTHCASSYTTVCGLTEE
jgi:hypothetical protein